MDENKDHGAGLAAGENNTGLSEINPASDIRARVIRAGTGWCAFTHQHDNSKAAMAAAIETLDILDERIRCKFTPALNTGTAMDALILVGAALREIRAVVGSHGTHAVSEAIGSAQSEAP